MKIVLSLILFFAVPAGAFATSVWRLARVHDVHVQETFPVSYRVGYERRCNDVLIKPVKFVEGDEVVVGVAVKNEPSNECWKNSTIVSLKSVVIRGDENDPDSVRTLD